MYLRDDDPYVEEHAMIIKEILKQRILGIKNKSGVYITPTFPKLIYVLGENNITKDSKYYDITRLAAECTTKRMYPDYISEKVMKENYDGSVFGCMGCLSGEELITYKLGERLFVESFKEAWNHLIYLHDVKVQPAGGNNLFIEPKEMKVWDNAKNDFVKVSRFNKNEETDMVKVCIDNLKNSSRWITCTNDHIFTTVDGVDKRADELIIGKDKIYMSNFQYSEESIIYQSLIDSAKEGELTIRSTFNVFSKEISSEMFSWDRFTRLEWLAAYIESCYYYDEFKINQYTSSLFLPGICVYEKSTILKMAALFRSVKVPTSVLYHTRNNVYHIRIELTEELISHIRDEKLKNFLVPSDTKYVDKNDIGTVVGCYPVNGRECSYDLTTESEHFEVSGVYSHNCRSFLSIYVDPETGERKWEGRLTPTVKPTLNDVNVRKNGVVIL